MSKNIAIIGASYLQLPLIKKAKELGFITHVFAWKANDVGEKEADYFYPISITEKEAILNVCKEINISAVCSIASDLAAVTVNYIASKLNLSGNSLHTTEISTNKYKMRSAFLENNDPSPKFILVNDVTEIEKINLQYPLIVKPTDRSGSRGIYKVNNFDELKNAISLSKNQSFEQKVLVEEFVEGEEYSVEYITFKGKHYFLNVTKKFTTGSPHFIETAHLEPANLDNTTMSNVKKVVEHALNTLGIKNSASHSEIKIDNNKNIKIIEIGGRMGGDCIGSDLVYYSTGIDFVKAVIDVACGIKPDLQPKKTKEAIMVKFIFTEQDYADYLKIKNTDKYIKTVELNLGNIGKITDSSNRAGCYIYKV